MRNLMMSLLVVSLFGCASAPPRTKWTDKTMRVMIDPASIDANSYVKIQYAIVASGKWILVDRRDGFKAIKKEQEMLHRVESDRYDDREKYALWGKMYGVGGVIIAHAQCERRNNALNEYNRCRQSLAIMDTNSGEVLAVSEAQTDSDSWNEQPSWEDAVATLNDNFPKSFKKDETDRRLLEYKDLAKEEAIRQKEILIQSRLPAQTPAVVAPTPAPQPTKIIDTQPSAASDAAMEKYLQSRGANLAF